MKRHCLVLHVHVYLSTFLFSSFSFASHCHFDPLFSWHLFTSVVVQRFSFSLQLF